MNQAAKRGLACAVVAALVVVPGTAGQISNPDQSTPTTLYFHIFDSFSVFPINTQPMTVEFFDVVGANFPTMPDTPLGRHDYNTVYGFSTAGPVEYDFIENGRPRFHPERGIAQDVRIDQAVQPVAYFYIDVRDVFGGNDAPMLLPDLTVRVTMREGDDIGPDGTLDAGALIMGGSLTAHVAANHAVPGVEEAASATPFPDHPVLVPDAAGVVEFAVPLDIAAGTIPADDAYNVRIDWYQAPEAFGHDGFSMGWLRPVLDVAHLPRLEMAVRNPVYVDFLHPQVTAGTLLIHAGANSPWGTYDIDVDAIELSIEGPSAPLVVERVVSQHAHVHGKHDQSAEITYLWDFREEDAKVGEYQITMKVPNMAGTAVAVAKAGFVVTKQGAYGVTDDGRVAEADEGSEDKDAPLPLVALAPLLAAWARRRRPHIAGAP